MRTAIALIMTLVSLNLACGRTETDSSTSEATQTKTKGPVSGTHEELGRINGGYAEMMFWALDMLMSFFFFVGPGGC